MFRLLFGLIGTAALVAAFVYLAPDAWKERTLEFIADKPIIPDAIRKKVEDLLSTPHYRRTKLIEELEKNLGQLAEELSPDEDGTPPGAEESIVPSPAAKRAKKIIEESKKLIEELKQQNAESPAVSTAAKKVIENIIQEQLGSKSIQCATSTPE